MRHTPRIIFVLSYGAPYSFFISFLSRERKETKQRKETAARAKFASAHGAPPLSLKCLRHLFTEFLRQDAFLPLKAARRVGAPEVFSLDGIIYAAPANFAQAGPLTASTAWSCEPGAWREEQQRCRDVR